MKIPIFVSVFLLFVSPISVPAQSTASKQVSTFKIEAPQINTVKTIWVYVPKSYRTSNKRYPVIYMFDAQNLFDAKTSYVGEWKVDEYLDSLSSKEAIIIGIEHGNEKRIEELTPYPHLKHGGGQGDAFMHFIIDTLKPHVDVTYRTKALAEHTSVFGASLGGLMAIYATVKYPDTFSKAGVFSPAFWINDEIFELAASADVPKTSKFYFLVGGKEGDTMVPDQQKMVSLLLKNGVNVNNIKNVIIEDGEHNEAFWSSHFPQAYDWLIQ